ncbi:MAG: hypothetical protein C0614_06245 [Desulfuromonas sp.]|nr:MAG: hypothetical protein C0614_06245 [Desulfuromonas sp.]
MKQWRRVTDLEGVGWLSLVFLLGLVLSGSAGIASAKEADLQVGSFLVARESLPDPRFNKSVILLIQHDEAGSGGLIVNRPSRLQVAAVLGEREQLQNVRGLLSYGGPVAEQALLALVKVMEPTPAPSAKIFDDLYVTDVTKLLPWLEQEGETLQYRIFRGYTGWAPGQLEREIARGDWWVEPADAGSVFAGNVKELWWRLSGEAVR